MFNDLLRASKNETDAKRKAQVAEAARDVLRISNKVQEAIDQGKGDEPPA